ncbi:TPA: hypothetical protein U2M17_000857 [Providencia stuartii]|uniref:Uncharacterized protein n=1 Tax=Providencia huashanensis TaxID=3037798 RepID=A0ABT9AQ98_9GAMM|nr:MULTISPECIES: hypothetical protein [Providencia]AXO19649.1 hypothetical protein MC79_014200 [Providencia stuartii]MBN5591629.1 hypothetical protein [Providencia stuartii]MDO7832364.1 hypothetical protein [Providencia sp. CRE-138-0026]MDO7856800.1 hypothetical protein [Providencia sp. CRE-138-0111]HEM6905231.1 hypothetical protein [Providencia stuartii]
MSKQDKYLKVSNDRERYFYSSYISKTLNLPLMKGHLQSEKELNQAIKNNLDDATERVRFIREVKDEFRCNVIQNEAFDWIKSNERCAFFILYYLNHYLTNKKIFAIHNHRYRGMHRTSEYERINYPTPLGEYEYRKQGLSQSPNNTKDALDNIMYFFDLLDSSIEKKIEVLEYLKQEWMLIKDENYLSWIDERNPTQMEWAKNYIARSRLYYRWSRSEVYTFASEKVQLIGCFDISFDVSPDSKELLIIKMKKAWSQENYRSQISEKKVLNTYLDKGVKDKLSRLAKRHRMKINEYLTYLIEKEDE